MIKYMLSQDNMTVIAGVELIDGYKELTEEEYNSIISGNPIPYYWNGSAWESKQKFSDDITVNLNCSEVYNIPLPTDYTKLYINNSETTDTTLKIDNEGTYEYKIEPFPYLPYKIIANVTFTLEQLKEKTINQISQDCNIYVLKNYPQTRQHTFKAQYIKILEELVLNKESYAEEQLDSMNTARSKLSSVFDWINQILDYYYSKLDSIKAATSKEEVTNITWDFEQFNNSNPNVTIEEIKKLLNGIL